VLFVVNGMMAAMASCIFTLGKSNGGKKSLFLISISGVVFVLSSIANWFALDRDVLLQNLYWVLDVWLKKQI